MRARLVAREVDGDGETGVALERGAGEQAAVGQGPDELGACVLWGYSLDSSDANR